MVETSTSAPSTAAAKKPRLAKESGLQKLPVFVCEYHDEALRCLHFAIRRRKLPFEGVTMVHLDAHPDMSASTSLPAEAVFRESWQVYSALRADAGGIAQWILPAVFGGHLNRVWWVRPEWARQIADGSYHVHVGQAPVEKNLPTATSAGADVKRKGSRCARLPSPQSAGDKTSPADRTDVTAAVNGEKAKIETIKISCAEPYFVEDGIYAATTEMTDAKPLHFLVSTLPESCVQLPLQSDAGCQATQWVLDVCLDFFACGNPFLSQVRSHVAAAFADIQNSTTFRSSSVKDVPKFLAQRDAFDAAYNSVLRLAAAAENEQDVEDGEGDNVDEGEDDGEDDEGDELEAALKALGEFLPAEHQAALIAKLRAVLPEMRESELLQIREAGDMVTLPLHPPSEGELHQRIATFEDFLVRLSSESTSNGLDAKPSAVTIARSVVDGFCPMRWLCVLEQAVLSVVERHFGAMDVIYHDELDAKESM